MKPENRWMVRERVEADHICHNGIAKTKKYYQLVWGHEGKNQKDGTVIIGESYHEIHGPTAYASVASFAEDLNMRRVPPSKVPTFGKPPKNDPAQLSLMLVGKDLGKSNPKP